MLAGPDCWDFTAALPDMRWCGDVTYIKTWDGWAYLATVIDLYSRKVVGWAVAAHMRTSLVVAALDMAIAARKPPAGVIFHSDRGCKYQCHLVKRAGISVHISTGQARPVSVDTGLNLLLCFPFWVLSVIFCAVDYKENSQAAVVAGGRLTDRIGIGVLTRLVPRDLVDEILAETGRGRSGPVFCLLMSSCIS